MKLQLLIAIGHQDYMEHLSDVLTQRYGETFEVSVCSTGERLRELLSRNVGQYAAASFLVGSCRLVRQEGVLEEVGTDYLVLRQGNARTGCDLYALKFIELTDSAGT